jgi:hypothetical protein
MWEAEGNDAYLRVAMDNRNGTFDYADMVNRKVNDCWKPRNLEAGESITLQPVAKTAMHLD